MSILTKPYEISVWEDNWSPELSKFEEKRVGIIGSQDMLYQGRALEPTLTRNVNGVKKMSFKMYKYFIDNETGEKVCNPFVDWLASERKVKLKYETYTDEEGEVKDKWYDFIVKNIVENSSNYLYTYQLEDALVQELSKNGFGVTLDAELMNNMGDVEYLATETLKETDWTVESEIFVERVDEALVYVQLPPIQGNKIIHKLVDNDENFLQNGLIDEEDNSIWGKEVLAFYSSCRNKPHRFQFIYLPNYSKANVSVDKNRQILNKNCQYYIEFESSEYTAVNTAYDFVLPAGFSVIEKTYSDNTSPSDSTISTWYRGGRYGFAQKALYVPLLDKYCQVYQGPVYDDSDSETNTSNEYYGYMENLYKEPVFGVNLITNTEFSNTSGWTATYNANGNISDKAVVENVYGKFIGDQFVSIVDILAGTANIEKTFEEFLNDTSNKCAPYMKIQLKTSNSLVINSGPYDNRTIIENMPVGSKWAFRAECFSSTGDPIDLSSTDDSVDLEFSIDEYTYDTATGYYSAPSSKKITFTTTTSTDKNNKTYTIYTVNTNGFADEIDFTKNCKLKIAMSGTGTYYIKNLEFFLARFDKDDKVIPFDKQGETIADGIVAKKYRYFKPSELNTATEVKDIYYDYETDTLSYNTYKPVYNIHGEKIRAVNAKESNYFNILQGIAETFECWLDLEIKRDDPNQPGAITEKIAKFKNYAGGDNYACFRYGVNLKDIQRTYSSKNIVTKLMVKQNSNEHGENGFCTIARAGANPTGDTSIYDFSYFQNMGLMDAHDYIDIMYKIDGAEGPDACECLYSASESKPNLPSKFEEPTAEWHQGKQKDDKYVCSWKKTVTDEETTYICVSTEAREIKDEYNLQGYFPRIRTINNQLLNQIDVEAGAKQELLTLNAELEVQKTKQSAAASGMEESAESFLQLTGAHPTGLVDGVVPINSITLGSENKYGDNITDNDKIGYLSYYEGDENPEYALSIIKDDEQKTIAIIAIPHGSTFTKSKTLIIKAYPILTTSGGATINRTLYFTLDIKKDEVDAITDPQVLSIDTSASQIQKYFNEYAIYAQEKHEADIKVPELESDIAEKQAVYDSLVATIDTLREHKTVLNKLFFTLYSRFIQEGTWIDEEYYDDEKYYNDALSVMYNSCYPQVAYTINTYEVSQLPGYEMFNFDVGEKTWAEDGEFFGFDDNGYPKREEVIITEKSENLDDPSKNTNKVQNFKNQFQDLFQKITATVQQTQYSTGAYEKGVAEANAIAEDSVGFLRDAISKMAVNLDNPQVFSESTDKSSQLKIVDGKILIGERDPNTEEISWKTGLSSGGIAADLINTGRLNTSEIQIYGSDNPTFRWDSRGISAYDYTTFSSVISGVNTKKFVRFDKYGIYGINGTADGSSWTPGWNNKKTAAQDIDDNATFALTWEGLKVTGNDKAVARIGKHQVATQSMIISVVDKDGNTTFSVTNNGEVQANRVNLVNSTINGKEPVSKDDLPDISNFLTTDTFIDVITDDKGVTYTIVKGKDGKVISTTKASQNYVATNVGFGPNSENTNFILTQDGLLTASNAIVHGTIFANSGQIGGMTIGDFVGLAKHNLILNSNKIKKPGTSIYAGEAVKFEYVKPIKNKQEYTISFEVDDPKGCLNRLEIGFHCSNDDIVYMTEKEKGIYDPSNKYSFTFTTPETLPSDLDGELWIYGYHNGEQGKDWSKEENLFRISKIKLETGPSATAWCPAESEISFLKNIFTNSKDLTGKIVSGESTTATGVDFTIVYGNNMGLTQAIHPDGWPYWQYKEILQFSNILVEENSAYTLSFIAKGKGVLDCYFFGPGNQAGEYPACIKAVSSQGDISTAGDGNIGIRLTDQYVLYSITWHIGTGTNAEKIKHVLFRLHGDEYSSENISREVYIYAPKLEKGYAATDWDDGIDILRASVDNSFSWKFSPSEGVYMYNGAQNDKNTVFKIYQPLIDDGQGGQTKGPYTAWIKGHIEATSGQIGGMTIGDITGLTKQVVGKNMIVKKDLLNREIFTEHSKSGYGFSFTTWNDPATHIYARSNTISVKPGATYVCSFKAWIYYDANNTSYKQRLECDFQPDYIDGIEMPQSGVFLTMQPTDFYVTLSVPNNLTKEQLDANSVCIRFFNDIPDAEGNRTKYPVYVTDIKLEEGTVATPWCLADEDLMEEHGFLPASVDNDFSWKFSPTEGMYIWNGTQGEITVDDPIGGAVFAVYKEGDEHKLCVKGRIEASGGHIDKLIIQNGGLIGENYSINASGLNFTASDATIEFSNFKIYNSNYSSIIEATGSCAIKSANGGLYFQQTQILKLYQHIYYREAVDAFRNIFYFYSTWADENGNPVVCPKDGTTTLYLKTSKMPDKVYTEAFNEYAGRERSAVSEGETFSEGYTVSVYADQDCTKLIGKFQTGKGEYTGYLGTSGKTHGSSSNEISMSIEGHAVPKEPNVYQLGASNAQWSEIYCKNSTINTSDKNEKNFIETLSDCYDGFFDDLLPIRYKFKKNESDRYHTGFIAQDVLEALINNNISTQEFAGYISFSKNDGTCGYGLRYNEFISLNTWQIQKLKPRVFALEQTILDYETRISNLETEIQNLKSN